MKDTIGSLEGIAYREKKRGPMMEVLSSDVSKEAGVVVDFKRRPSKRQVTVMSLQSWRAACEALGLDLHWTTRRANLLTSGIDLGAEDVGKIIQIGDMQLLINYETDPCELMDSLQPGLRMALTPEWRGGVCCTVVQSGNITVGDQVELVG